jgi:hypothetical protein
MKKFIFDNKYIIYSDGKIWSVKRKKFLKPSFHHTGYTRVNINNKCYNIHRLIAEAFIPNPNNFTDINHINEIKTDNRVENLEWCTHRYNSTHTLGKKFTGCFFYKGKYRVRIYFNKKHSHIGSFNTIEEAYQFRINFINKHNL